MSSDFPRFFAVAAIIVVLLAVGVLGIIIGYNLKPATSVSASSEKADITLVVQSDLTLGPDGQLHDSFVPCNFTVYAKQVVDLTVVNYDSGEHSFTSPSLGVNFAIPPSNVTGSPTVSNFQFTEAKAGVYRWYCTFPCDTDAGGWAMTTGTDGQPDQIGFMGGFVTVLPG
ncbi:MAG: cupredoxin domain-containing protein [Candidatus Bathyarchaeia archaeon]|jgi:hypothetical protein